MSMVESGLAEKDKTDPTPFCNGIALNNLERPVITWAQVLG